MKTFVALPILGLLLWASIHAGGQTETTAGWVKHPKNPVFGGSLGTCFDISVLKEGDTYRMWFSWRPKKSIALVESKDGDPGQLGLLVRRSLNFGLEQKNLQTRFPLALPGVADKRSSPAENRNT